MARQALAARTRWGAVAEADNVLSAETQTNALLTMGRLLKRTTDWFLQHAPQPLDISAAVACYVPGIEIFRDNREAILTAPQCGDWQRRRDANQAEGWPENIAARMADAPLVISVLDVARIGEGSPLTLPDIGRVYFQLGDRFGLQWLREQALGLRPDVYWDKLAVTAIVDDLYGHQVEIAQKILANGSAPDTPAIDEWSAGRGDALARTTRMLEDLKAAPRLDVAMLAVANRQLRALAGG